jgi:WD40 repeat protein
MRFRPLCAWLLALAVVPIVAELAAAEELTAGDPLVLKHPQINDSVGNPVHCLTFLADGQSLATGATSGVLIWDVKSGRLRETLEADQRAVDSIALDRRGEQLVAGGASGIIKVYSGRTLKLVHTLGPTPGAVRGLAISPDGQTLATASPVGQKGAADREFAIILWNLSTGEQAKTIAHPPPDFGTTVLAFLPDGKRLVSAQDRALRLWDVEKSEAIKTVELPELPRTLGAIAVRGDGQQLATGAYEPRIRLFSTQTWAQTLSWAAHDKEPPPRFGVYTVNYSPDGRYLLSGGLDGMASVWDAATGKRLLELDARGEASGRWITGVAMTPTNDQLAASHFGGTATIWRITERE